MDGTHVVVLLIQQNTTAYEKEKDIISVVSLLIICVFYISLYLLVILVTFPCDVQNNLKCGVFQSPVPSVGGGLR